MQITLENAYFLTIKDGIVIFKMSHESLSEFLSENNISWPDEDYLDGDLKLTIKNGNLINAGLWPVYDYGSCMVIDVKNYIEQEVIDLSIEELAEDNEHFARTLEDFHKF